MPRAPRVEFPGAFYHVIARGNNQNKIFLDEEDREKYLGFFKKYKQKFEFRIYAFVLMENHVHFLIETNESGSLSKIMHSVHNIYVKYFNYKYDLKGHVFMSRYKSILCEKDEYLLELSRYLHLNPVRAGIVKNPLDYLWSSYRAYLGIVNSDFIDTDFILSQFGKNPINIVLYKEFVEAGIKMGHQKDFYKLKVPGTGARH